MTSLDNTVPVRRVALIADAATYVGPALATMLAARGHDLVLGQPKSELVEHLVGNLDQHRPAFAGPHGVANC